MDFTDLRWLDPRSWLLTTSFTHYLQAVDGEIPRGSHYFPIVVDYSSIFGWFVPIGDSLPTGNYK